MGKLHDNDCKSSITPEMMREVDQRNLPNPTIDPVPDGISRQQFIFCVAYLTCYNISEAGRLAKYACTSSAHEMFRKPEVKNVIEQLTSEYAMSASEVVAKLSEMTHGKPIGHYVEIDSDGNPYIDYAAAKADGALNGLRSLKTIKGEPAVDLGDRMVALDKLARIHALYNDKVAVAAEIESTNTNINLNVDKPYDIDIESFYKSMKGDG